MTPLEVFLRSISDPSVDDAALVDMASAVAQTADGLRSLVTSVVDVQEARLVRAVSFAVAQAPWSLYDTDPNTVDGAISAFVRIAADSPDTTVRISCLTSLQAMLAMSKLPLPKQLPSGLYTRFLVDCLGGPNFERLAAVGLLASLTSSDELMNRLTDVEFGMLIASLCEVLISEDRKLASDAHEVLERLENG